MARDADLPQLQDLAELDCSAPLTGLVLVALIDGTPAAAIAIETDRVIADPFRATGAAVELLRLRVEQLRSSETPWRTGALWGITGLRRRRAAHRARA